MIDKKPKGPVQTIHLGRIEGDLSSPKLDEKIAEAKERAEREAKRKSK